MDPRRDGFRRLLRAGLVRRAPRQRPRDEGEVVAMAKMARRSWLQALRNGEITRTKEGFLWRPELRP